MKILDGVQGSMRTNRRPGARCTVKLGATECAMDALARATGMRIRDLPLTPERVWAALRAAQPPSPPSR